MDEIKDFARRMRDELPVEFDAMPDIDLYMDQVLAFLSRKQVSGRDGDSLTSAMINNYIKDGLVPRANGKKYSREHLVYLSLVARLKQVLSVKDMTVLLKKDIGDGQHAEYYAQFRQKLDDAFAQIAETPAENESISRLAFEFALHSYASKVASEDLIDLLAARDADAAPAKAAAKAAAKKAKPEPKQG